MSTTELMNFDPPEPPATVSREIQHAAPTVIELVQAALMSRDVDVAKLSAIVDLRDREEARLAKREFKSAMAKLQAEMPRIKKSAIVPNDDRSVRYKFTPIEDLDAVLKPLYTAHGFSVAWRSRHEGERIVVVGELSHRDGHSESHEFAVRYSTPPKASAAQGDGSTLAYGKRQVYKMMFNIVEAGIDNDGAGEPDGTITSEQVLEIEALLSKTNSNVPKFLEHFGIAKIADLPASKLSRVLEMLDGKGKASIRGGGK